MPSQMELKFSKNTIHNINIYREAAKSESIGDDGYNVKFTPTQKAALQSILQEYNMSASRFLREAMDMYLDLFPYRAKLRRHRRLLRGVLDKLT